MRSRSIVRCAGGLTSVALFGALITGCLAVDPPEGAIQCTTSAECPSSEWTCRASRCHRGSGGEDAGVDASEPMDASSDAAIDGETSDTGIDAPSDGGPITDCNPHTHAPCAADQRCGWVPLTPDSGETRCLPSATGTGLAGDACVLSEPETGTGFDDCARGLTCLRGTCEPVCDLADRASCGTTATCIAFAGLFANTGETPVAGVCQPSCDPLTQLRLDGSSCPAGEACYELPSETGPQFLCASEGSVEIGATIEGSVVVNSCRGGARPLPRLDGTTWCAPFCRPVETHSGATAGAHGASPYTCADVGAGATEECLFAWLLYARGVFDPRLNTLGVCIPVGTYEWDHDMNPATPEVPWSSCTTRSMPDHRAFGCAPHVP